MKQAGYSKRPYSRSPERHRHHQRQVNGDSNENKMRGNGNPQQSVEKYLNLAREAASSGDPISAENYYQYADHYYRISLANRLSRTQRSDKLHDGRETQVVADVTPEAVPSVN